LVGPDDADALISGVSSESELLASLGPVVGISRLASGRLSHQAFLDDYGHRGSEEFELSKPRLAEDPGWLDQQLAGFKESGIDADAMLAEQRAEFEAAWQRFCERYPEKERAMRGRIDQVPRRARLREAARSELARVLWVLRTWVLRSGEITGLGEDVFFFNIDELLNYLAGDESVHQFIPARRETYYKYKSLPAYPAVIHGCFDPFKWAADPNRRIDIFDARLSARPETSTIRDPDKILGAPGSAGQVEGTVRLLGKPEEGAQLEPGEILVTVQTNIGWTPLFPRAAAIITDVGAPLSHAAVVARELGIPAVVGCGDATMRLRTGDQVKVDGGLGTVEILDTA
jgi:pyruvate,water dikinase